MDNQTRMDQIRNAAQIAINYNQNEYQRAYELSVIQGMKYAPQYKSYLEFLPPETSTQNSQLTKDTR